MNILFISQNSPFESIGGIERYIDNLINFYKNETSSSTKLYLMLPSNNGCYVEENNNVTIIFDDCLQMSKKYLVAKKEASGKAQQFAENISQIIKKNKIDIICAENFHTGLPPAYSLVLNMVTMSLKIPIVLQIHSFATSELQTELINQLKWDKIICVSKSVAGDCYQKGADINSIYTHYLGVDTDEFNNKTKTIFNLKDNLGLSQNSKIILTATRIIRGRSNILKEKGIVNLIESFSKLSPRYPDLKLLIAVGKPPENLKDEFNLAFELLQGYIKLHNVEKNTILKMFSLHEMPDVYKGSDVFVLASENETFGQVFIEAMGCGLPVIGTNVGGIPEIISDSNNGYLIPPDNSSVLAQRIETIINGDSISNNFVNEGIKTVKEKFSSTLQFKNFNEIMKSIINHN